MTTRYSVHIILDSDCTEIRRGALGVYATLGAAKDAAAEANSVFGVAIRDNETNLIDFGAGFGVAIDACE